MRRVLIVANETAGGSHLADEIRHRVASGPLHVTLLVPPSRPHGSFTWTDGQARALARGRMDQAVARWSAMGADVAGMIGVAPTPFDCVMDLVRDQTFDEIIVSTLPHAVSRWLRMDLPHRIERVTGQFVTHVMERTPEHSLA